MLRFSKAGFSLIEVLVAVAITSIVGTMIVTLMSNMGNMSAFYSAREDYDSIHRATQLLLLNEGLCAHAMKDAGGADVNYDPTADRSPVDHIIIPDSPTSSTGTTFITAGQFFGGPNNRLRVKNIYLVKRGSRYSMSLPNPPNPDDVFQYYSTELRIEAENVGGGPSGIQIKPIPLHIGIRSGTPDAAGPIASCYATASSAALCAALHARFNSSTNQCEIDACDVNTGPLSAGAPDCDPDPGMPMNGPGERKCTPRKYYLAYTTTKTPQCLCTMSCQGPQGIQGVPGNDFTPPPPPPVYYY